ncbi:MULTISPECIES: hypothetical protein [Desulfovibrio]|uniref:Uncharacterized protein n=1 Tax=Desulfovibrio desulfuricans TaxID=876 RepID=A0AA94HQZ4_DESDE|nr:MULTISPECIES: hypothetical protein [Desulfovibrio]ATD81157.1 hypothetical protein CNY67_07005 [Desulfovibrio sp. G11]SFW22663.1 hypothetical protein SAMN02910291_00458 [Desulfovibrio desulfuricans]SPD36777.1 Hypothetical protein DSVG11_2743 [Desulfovibrio sp. G11]
MWGIVFAAMIGAYVWADFFKRKREQRIRDQVKMFRHFASIFRFDKNSTAYEIAFDRVLAGDLDSYKNVPRYDEYGQMSDDTRAFFLLFDGAMDEKSLKGCSLAREILSRAKDSGLVNEDMYSNEREKIENYEEYLS